MAKELVPDELWAVIQPLLPPEMPKPKGGRPRVPDRATLTGILFVLHSGLPWEMLPREMGCGSGMTCWRRLRDWQDAGVWQRLHRLMLDRLGIADQIDWSRASADATFTPAKKGAMKSARTGYPLGAIGARRPRRITFWWTARDIRSRCWSPPATSTKGPS
jgi:transposase